VSQPAVVVEGLVAGYGGAPIVTGASLAVQTGELTVLLGPNGAGKSTLLKALMGLIPRTAGRVLLRGEDVTAWPPQKLVKEGVAYVPQLRNVFTSLSVLENLEIGGYSLGGRVRGRAREVLDMFPPLQSAANRPAGTLSGGERTLLALARGLMPTPSVLMADEPSAGLSPKNEVLIWDYLRTIRDSGVGILVVEQNVARALEYCDVGYVLVLGKVVLQGTGRELEVGDRLASLYIGLAASSLSEPATSGG
jgi:branched-chain amino acid transport system ATP-binding protein